MRINITYVRRGEIWIGDLGDGIGSEQEGLRPLLILQNDKGNKYSKTTIVAPITSVVKKAELPTHVPLPEKFLPRYSVVLLEQIRTISKERLSSRVGKITEGSQRLVDEAFLISGGLEKYLSNTSN